MFIEISCGSTAGTAVLFQQPTHQVIVGSPIPGGTDPAPLIE